MLQSLFQISRFITCYLPVKEIKLGRLLNANAIFAFIPVALCFGTVQVSVAQTSDTRLNNNISPGFLSNSNSYSIDSGVTCPTSTFNIAAFGGFADSSANDSVININSNSNLNDFGVAAGFSIPLGGSLGRFCKEYAAKQLIISEQTIQENQATAISNLLNACLAFTSLKVDFESSAFSEGGPFARYATCKDVGFTTASGEPTNQSVPGPKNIQPLSPTPTDVRIIP